MLKSLSQLLGQNKLALVLVLLGSLAWSLTMVKSGLCWDAKCVSGMGFWGPNGHDGVWHIALAKSLARGSLEMPVFASEQLKNYHIGFDLLLALVYKITSIPISTLYFQIVPPLLALGVGIATYYFVYKWKKSKTQAWWATFFVYFGGSWSWLFAGGESMFWSQQSISTLVNPPFALSILVLLLGLIFLQHKKYLLAALIFGTLIQIKVYAGLIALGGLFIVSINRFINTKDLSIFKVFILTLLISIVLFLPLNGGSGSLLVWQPFWFLETMMGLSDRVGWDRFYEAMMNYKLAGNYVKLAAAYLIAFIIFWFGNLGTRVIKEVYFFKTLRDLPTIEWQDLFLLTAIGVGITFPMFFVQSGTPWNTIQFFYYSLIFSGILAGIAVSEIGSKFHPAIRASLYGLVIIFTLPTTLLTLYHHYLPSRPPAKISQAELEALNFLAIQPNGVVLTYPYDAAKAREAEANPPRPLYLYESTAYVSAYANKPVYLEDEVNLTIMNYEWKQRREAVEAFYKSLDEARVRSFLLENKIDYIYWVKPQRATLGETQLGLERLFENEEVDIYKVKQ